MDLPVTLVIEGEPRQETIRNLSLGGAFVETSERLAMGTRVELTFQIPTYEEPIRAGGQVRWNSELGIGVQFEGLRAKEVWSLNKFFEQLD